MDFRRYDWECVPTSTGKQVPVVRSCWVPLAVLPVAAANFVTMEAANKQINYMRENECVGRLTRCDTRGMLDRHESGGGVHNRVCSTYADANMLPPSFVPACCHHPASHAPPNCRHHHSPQTHPPHTNTV